MALHFPLPMCLGSSDKHPKLLVSAPPLAGCWHLGSGKRGPRVTIEACLGAEGFVNGHFPFASILKELLILKHLKFSL